MPTVIRYDDLPRLVTGVPGDDRFRLELATRELLESNELMGHRLTYHPGDAVPEHFHTDARHLIFTLEGTGTIHTKDGTTELREGDVAVIQKAEVHYFENATDRDWTFIELTFPAPSETVWTDSGYTPQWIPGEDQR
jgi:quercetin dioxygenase-like cupin family protein